ncbi:MAG: hypothetical protein QM673_06225 [Gordonia sp. (in: high G+C Gram-positive bacteria)]
MTLETGDRSTQGETTSMGVSAGAGMIHYVLLTQDGAGRTVVDARVIEVDRTDGIDPVGRVNAGIDLMLDAAREQGRRVGPIGIAARSTLRRHTFRSGGSGTRRQVQMLSEEEAVVAYLTGTGQIGRYENAVVVDCGDTVTSMYAVSPATGKIGPVQRSKALSGRLLDDAIARSLADEWAGSFSARRTKVDRTALRTAARTAKEEIGEPGSGESAVLLTGHSSRIDRAMVDRCVVEAAARPLIAQARRTLADYLSENPADAVVLVGGMANLAVLREVIPDAAPGREPYSVVIPPDPELVAATGAAMLARQGERASTRLVFLGGRRRNWFSPTPLLVAAAVIAATLMAIGAVNSSLTRHSEVVAPSTTAQVTTTAPTSAGTDETGAASLRIHTPLPQHLSVTRETSRQLHPEDGPGWATTELPLTAPLTTTRTLIPAPKSLPKSSPSTPSAPSVPSLPSGLLSVLPLPPGITIPPRFLPPDMRPLQPNTPPVPTEPAQPGESSTPDTSSTRPTRTPRHRHFAPMRTSPPSGASLSTESSMESVVLPPR